MESNRQRRKTPHARELANKARNKMYKENESFRLSINMRSRIRIALKRQELNKNNSTYDLLGCSIEELKIYLESQFVYGMSWDNYTYDGWHIDHKIPCASFDLSKEEELRKCFHWSNLRPLWAKDNISKGCKIINEQIT